MRTAIVILNWNTADYLRRFLPPLLASLPEGAEVVVADSASTDESMKVMDEQFPSVRQIRLDKNYGFTGGYNRAFKELQDVHDMEYFILMNTDIEVPEGWLEPLIEWMDAHPDCAACAPKLHSWYKRDTFDYAGAAGGMLDHFGYPFCRGRVLKKVEKDSGQYDSTHEVFWATGACLVMRKSAYSEMGGLDDRFFAHMEEIDLCWRLQLEGMIICIVPSSVVYHLGGGTLPQDSPWKLKLNFRNDLLMLENNAAKTYSLENMSKGLSPQKAASKAVRKARRLIFIRKCLDRCSAAVYLLTGKIEYFKAVLHAHKEFKQLRRGIELAGIERFAESHQGIPAPRLFRRWIIPLAMAKGNGIFEYLRKTL